MIVGHKIERFLTATRADYREPWMMVQHVRITELHATKGWRVVRHTRNSTPVKRLPPLRYWRDNDTTTFKRTAGPLVRVNRLRGIRP